MHLPQDIQNFKNNIRLWFGGLFIPGREIHISRAPLRLDVMGGTADDAGSVMLGSTLESAVITGLQKRRDMRILIKGVGLESPNSQAIIEFHFDQFYENGSLKSLEQLNLELTNQKMPIWAIMVLGTIAVLLREKAVTFQNGVTIGVKSPVVIHSGVNTGSSLQTSVLLSLKSAFDLTINAFEIAEYCRQADHFCGIPCGIMAPVTCVMGKKNRLIAMRCQPHELLKMVPIPDTLKLLAIDFNLPFESRLEYLHHARTAAFMGKNIIFQKLDSNPYNDYLCNIGVNEWENRFCNWVPKEMTGREYLDQYENPSGSGFEIKPDMVYKIKELTAFPIYENERVLQFIKHFEAFIELRNRDHLEAAGQLMNESDNTHCLHKTYDETRFVLDYLQNLGHEQGIHGARSAGCSFGGAVVVLADRHADDHINTLIARYYDRFQSRPVIYQKSSAGALEQGTITSKL